MCDCGARGLLPPKRGSRAANTCMAAPAVGRCDDAGRAARHAMAGDFRFHATASRSSAPVAGSGRCRTAH